MRYIAAALVGLVLQGSVRAQDSLETALGEAMTAAKKAAASAEGPAAAWEFEKRYRTDRPIPFTATPNITPLTEQLWARKQIVEDFKKNKQPGQVAILVVVKTELCCVNKFRLCAVTTAALHKHSTPELKKFRIYGGWIKNSAALPAGADAATVKAKNEWDEKLIKEYSFEQGPGATLFFINPETEQAYDADAHELELYAEVFDRNQGRTPILESKLKWVLGRFSASRPAAAP